VFSYIQRERESSGDDAVIAVTVERWEIAVGAAIPAAGANTSWFW
jgi:hypothetical protein